MVINMRIAVMADRPSLDATVPEEFESSPAMVVIESDDESLFCAVEGPDTEKYVQTMVACDCEAVVCSPKLGPAAVEPIVSACSPRYTGQGRPGLQALRGAVYNKRDIIPEYDGGPGCNSGEHSCEEGGCGAEHE
jgi:predicted Fe-Mo cluster-binding NifX family protein